MKNIAVLGCASVDSIMYMKNFPEPIPQTLIADRFYETVGSTGSGKALSLSKFGFDVNFHAQIGDDYYGHKIIDFMDKYENLSFIYNFDRIDTNGAGDNFMSGFMYAYLNKYDFHKCMQYGTIAAGLCINSPELINKDLSSELIEAEYAKYYKR